MSTFDLQSSLMTQISGIISMLIEAGVDLNGSYRIYDRNEITIRTPNITVLDAIFTLLMSWNFYSNYRFGLDFVRLDCVLSQHGCEVTEELVPPYLWHVSPYTLDILIRNPEVALGECHSSFPPH